MFAKILSIFVKFWNSTCQFEAGLRLWDNFVSQGFWKILPKKYGSCDLIECTFFVDLGKFVEWDKFALCTKIGTQIQAVIDNV